jgi:hypothetical protein
MLALLFFLMKFASFFYHFVENKVNFTNYLTPLVIQYFHVLEFRWLYLLQGLAFL